jgi:two-component system, OmpR family, phosphate regulon response regulator PhoB
VEAGNKKRILVVDDDTELQQLIRLLLDHIGIEAIPALTAASAAQILRTTRPLPDLMILDMMLPDVSGIELLRQMRAKEVFNDLPVLILSALADPMQIREGLNAGADRYLTKPYISSNLTTVVQELMRTGRRRDK